MDRYAVVGNPVEHSRSPAIHAAFARQTGQSLWYGRLLCPLDAFETTLRGFVADRAEGIVRGCNVTVPFKQEAWQLAVRRERQRRCRRGTGLPAHCAPNARLPAGLIRHGDEPPPIERAAASHSAAAR